MPRPYWENGKQGHYGRGIGDIDVSSDLAYNPPVPAGFVGPINPADYSTLDSYSAAVLSQWENAAAAAAAQPVATTNQGLVWLENNWPLLAIGGIIGLSLVKGV
jgi:hypothetical protein